MIEMILIPAAEFIMGITKEQAESAFTGFYSPAAEISPYQFYVEVPEHEVKVNSFLISKNETTNADFKQFMEGGGYENEDLWQEFVQAKKINTDLPGWKRIQVMVDVSGNPGLSRLEKLRFPSGKENHPVEGSPGTRLRHFAGGERCGFPMKPNGNLRRAEKTNGCIHGAMTHPYY